MNTSIVDLINLVVIYATDYLMPLLLLGFVVAVIARLLITVTVRRQKKFVKEFSKRIHLDISTWNIWSWCRLPSDKICLSRCFWTRSILL